MKILELIHIILISVKFFKVTSVVRGRERVIVSEVWWSCLDVAEPQRSCQVWKLWCLLLLLLQMIINRRAFIRLVACIVGVTILVQEWSTTIFWADVSLIFVTQLKSAPEFREWWSTEFWFLPYIKLTSVLARLILWIREVWMHVLPWVCEIRMLHVVLWLQLIKFSNAVRELPD